MGFVIFIMGSWVDNHIIARSHWSLPLTSWSQSFTHVHTLIAQLLHHVLEHTHLFIPPLTFFSSLTYPLLLLAAAGWNEYPVLCDRTGGKKSQSLLDYSTKKNCSWRDTAVGCRRFKGLLIFKVGWRTRRELLGWGCVQMDWWMKGKKDELTLSHFSETQGEWDRKK